MVNKIIKNNIKSEKGITLIALVITIIVLLILAGISITMLTGDNSILSRAIEAKTQTENKNREEQIKIEVMGSYGKDGNIDVATLKTNLEKIGATSMGNSLPLTVTLGEQEFTIDTNGNVTKAEDTPFTLKYQYGYLWADFNQNYVKDVDSLTEEQKQTVLDNYLLALRDSFEEEGDTEEQIESKISSYQYGFSLLNSTQKQQFISELLETIEITPIDTDEGDVWSAKYSRMLIKETGNYTATLYDCLTTPYKKVEKSINIQNLDEYIIDIGTDQYDCSYYISFKHFENNEYITAYADRVILKLDGVEMFNGVPPEHDEASFVYWYFQEMNNNIENNKEYMADITGYFGTKEVKFKGKIRIRFPS